MTSREWLNTIIKAQDVHPAMEKLIIKYGEMLLEENQTVIDGSDLKFTASSQLRSGISDIAEMNKAIECLYLEVSPEIADSIKLKFNNVKKHIEQLIQKDEVHWKTRNALLRDIERLRTYSDKLADGFPEGMLPKDIELINDSNTIMSKQINNLAKAVIEGSVVYDNDSRPSCRFCMTEEIGEDERFIHEDDCIVKTAEQLFNNFGGSQTMNKENI